jgi:DNA-binding transcriptional ArsR family regulator
MRIIAYTTAMFQSDALRRFKADIFQALAHPTRIAIAEALHRRELSAGQIIQLLELEQTNASQHLAVLRSKRIVIARKQGNQVFYSLRDPALGDVLDSLRGYFHRHLRQAKADLKEVSRLEARAR